MNATTEFQIQCEQRLNESFCRLGIQPESREVRWIGEPAIWVKVRDLHVWIYLDGAEIGGDGVDWRFEKYDYENVGQLIDALVSKLESLLHRNT